jgi:hypothetical protein
METKQNSAGLKNQGVDFYWIIKDGGTLHLEGKYMKVKTKKKENAIMCLLTPNFAKFDIFWIRKQSALCVNREADSQQQLQMKQGAC